MFILNSTVEFTIVRPKLYNAEIAADAVSVRAVGPNGVFSSIALTSDTSPTGSTEGQIVFSDLLSAKGVWRYEVLTATSVAHVINVNVVESTTTYTSTVKF